MLVPEPRTSRKALGFQAAAKFTQGGAFFPWSKRPVPSRKTINCPLHHSFGKAEGDLALLNRMAGI